MRGTSTRWTALAVALALVGPTTGCAAAAAAGAAGAIYATTRGVESLVNGSVPSVTARAKTVMAEMNIVPEGEETHTSGDKHELKGKQGDLDVSIAMSRADSLLTKVEVSARKNLAEWDKDYARTVLERIMKKD